MSEEPEAGKDLRSGLDEIGGDTDAVGSLAGARRISRIHRILQLVASAAERTKGAQNGSDLGSDGFFNCVVGTGGCRPKALLGKKSSAGLPCRIAGENKCAVSIY
jgi:hypothetical protein